MRTYDRYDENVARAIERLAVSYGVGADDCVDEIGGSIKRYGELIVCVRRYVDYDTADLGNVDDRLEDSRAMRSLDDRLVRAVKRTSDLRCIRIYVPLLYARVIVDAAAYEAALPLKGVRVIATRIETEGRQNWVREDLGYDIDRANVSVLDNRRLPVTDVTRLTRYDRSNEALDEDVMIYTPASDMGAVGRLYRNGLDETEVGMANVTRVIIDAAVTCGAVRDRRTINALDSRERAILAR